MKEDSLSRIHEELSQLKRDLVAKTRPEAARPIVSPAKSQPGSMLDLGLYLLAYLFWLLVITNALLAAGVAISPCNCLYAVPAAWLTLWLVRRKQPLRTLLIAVLGSAVILLCAYAVMFLYDFSWDGNWYHKVDTGLLAWGWNPFTQSMGDYAAQSGLITTRTGWQVWFDGYPKGTYTIGACFYALFGNIEAGKCFNLIGMLALLCIATPLIRRIGKLKSWQAFLIAFLLAANPIAVMKATSYYNDGFMAAMLTIFALSLYYLYLFEKGKLSVSCWLLIFLSLSIGLNAKYSGLIFFGMLGIAFYLLWMATHGIRHGLRQSDPFYLRVTLLFFAAVLCAVCLAGASTYIVNWLRYQNPLYAVIGQDATPLADQEMPVYLREYPKIGQFFYSIFSRATNEIYTTTESYWKLPFTISPEEWGYAASIDTRTSGWGIVFSGAFVVSVLVYIAALVLLLYRKAAHGHFYFLLLIFGYLLLPPAFIAGLWWARYYIHLYWLPAIALGLLFSACNHLRKAGKTLKTAGVAALASVIVGVMLVNYIPCYNYCQTQVDASVQTRSIASRLKALRKVYTYRLTFYNNDFYGFLFNFMDLELGYVVAQASDAAPPDIQFTGALSSYVTYDALYNTPPAQTAAAVLASLQSSAQNHCLLIAAAGAAGQAPDEQTVRALRALGLRFALADNAGQSYLAVIDHGTVLYEQTAPEPLIYGFTLDSRPFTLTSAGTAAGGEAAIVFDGVNLSPGRSGLHLAVYDPQADEVLAVAVLDSVSILAQGR